MRKVIMVCVVLLICLFAVGCGNTQESKKIEETKEIKNTEGSVEKEVSLLEVTPDSKTICDNEIEIYNGSTDYLYGYTIMKTDKTVYDKYVALCKDKKFTDVELEDENVYRALTTDKKYEINVRYMPSAKCVTVKTSRK